QKDPEEFTWSDWFKVAEDGQLVNFSQWYSSKLRPLLSLESRQQIVEDIKNNFREKVTAAMLEPDDWIDAKHKARLNQVLEKAFVRFVSPAGATSNCAEGF